jgi:ATP adenylyltransferase
MDYIKAPKPDECIFCAAVRADDDAGHYVVARGRHCFAMLNAFPYTGGHLMVSPNQHVPTLEEVHGEALLELMTLTQRSLAALREAYAPDGFNLGINQGEVAGAGVADHVHLHVVPRWEADTNFLTVIGSTRVLPQSLDDSWSVLSRHLA